MSNLGTTPVQSMIQTTNTVKRWTPPDTNCYKINFDASWVDENNLAGYGIILLSETGSAIQAGSGTFYAFSPEEAEALTLLEASRWATNMHFHLYHDKSPEQIIFAISSQSLSTKHKIVPDVKVHDQRKSSWFKYGFGYDIKTQDYKLVRFRCFEDKRRGTQIKVYSLASNSWSTALYMPYTLSLEPRPTALYLNGALYWLTDDSKLIVSFDLGDEIIREVPGPVRDNFFDNNSYQYKYVDVLGGCLCVVCVTHGVRGDVRVMKDYGVRESWTTEFTVSQRALK
ncbi:F-box/kelch-repeat protein At3g06240-like [Papaver somniferum]|uniref:F-box/kelch-repeat protein At3g06240-like n=1 Tax=Papaver somniferum TaxID=3469 RepID=UPI000E7018C0|nr:F-box/kelch-repeat protein At3g06240-like [Papaver somniferum]